MLHLKKKKKKKKKKNLHSSLGAADYVGVIKAVLHHRGVIESAEVRLPLVALPAARTAEVIASLSSLVAA